MSKVYKCDSCNQMIENPHDAKMKEFYWGYTFDFGIAIPEESNRKVKIHLCDSCFKGLSKIAKEREGK